MYVDSEYPSFQSSSVLYIKPTCTSSMQELIMQGIQLKLKMSDVKRTFGM